MAANEFQGWVRVEDEQHLTMRRRSTGATITATRAGISFEGNHQNAQGVEDAETPDVLQELLHFHKDAKAAHNVGAKAAQEAIAARRAEREGSAAVVTGGTGSPTPTVAKPAPSSKAHPAQE